MEKIKLNPKHKVDPENILKLVNKGDKTWVYLKKGYPKIIKANGDINIVICKLANSLSTEKLNEIINRK